MQGHDIDSEELGRRQLINGSIFALAVLVLSVAEDSGWQVGDAGASTPRLFWKETLSLLGAGLDSLGVVIGVCRTMRFICYKYSYENYSNITIFVQLASPAFWQKIRTFPTRRFTTFVCTMCVADSNLKLQSIDCNPLGVDVLIVRLWSLMTGEVCWCNLESVSS